MPLPLAARMFVMVLFREGLGHLGKGREREMMLKCAQHRANELGRPLVTIDPYDPREGQALVSGCCPSNGGQVASYLMNKGDIPASDDSVVVLCCHCLECVHDINKAWTEILRVAGSPSNVFVAHHRKTLFAPGRKWVIESAPPVSPDVVYAPVSRPYPPIE